MTGAKAFFTLVGIRAVVISPVRYSSHPIQSDGNIQGARERVEPHDEMIEVITSLPKSFAKLYNLQIRKGQKNGVVAMG